MRRSQISSSKLGNVLHHYSPTKRARKMSSVEKVLLQFIIHQHKYHNRARFATLNMSKKCSRSRESGTERDFLLWKLSSVPPLATKWQNYFVLCWIGCLITFKVVFTFRRECISDVCTSGDENAFRFSRCFFWWINTLRLLLTTLSVLWRDLNWKK